MPQINRDTFEKAEIGTKLLLIYDMLGEYGALLADHVKKQDETCERRSSDCDKRFLKIENRKKIDAAVSASGGIIGGFLAVIIKAKFWG